MPPRTSVCRATFATAASWVVVPERAQTASSWADRRGPRPSMPASSSTCTRRETVVSSGASRVAAVRAGTFSLLFRLLSAMASVLLGAGLGCCGSGGPLLGDPLDAAVEHPADLL